MKFCTLFKSDNRFEFITDIIQEKFIWNIIPKINQLIARKFENYQYEQLDQLKSFGKIVKLYNSDNSLYEISLHIENSILLPADFYSKGGILIEKNTFLEQGAIIKAPTIIGSDSEIRQSAYIRGNVIIGNNSIVGHTTEIKNSILMDHSAAGHFAYIGDSIIGSYVNLGAGTKIANLKFRLESDIRNGNYNEITVYANQKSYNTNLTKLGAIIGDYVEIGCNVVTSPGTFIGAGCWVSPGIMLPPAVYQSEQRIKSATKIELRSKR